MKHSLRLAAPLFALLVSTVAVSAQSMTSAWFVQASGGVGAHDNGPFSRRLQSYTPVGRSSGERLLYQTESFSNVGYSVGGALGFLFDGGIVAGASGEMVMFPTVEAVTSPGMSRDEYVLGGWEGGVDFGYVVVNEDATIVYPFVHAGYAGYSLEYSNRQSDSIPFFEGEPVAPQSTATYTTAAPRVAIGIGLNSFVGGGGVGGFLVGARVSYGRMLGAPEWEQNGATVNNGGHSPCYNAVTVSLAIGFGGGM